ncbi:MAG: glycosyltransferase 87 family protein [Planctomycetota bacterium]|jgi:hypothetical protein
MGLRATILACAAFTALVLSLLLATEQWGLGTRDDGSTRWAFLLEDISDRYVYQLRGRWLPGERAPYIEEHSEYPQLATWMFGLPYLFFDSAVPVGRAQTDAEFRAHPEDSRRYFDLHHVSMAVGYLALLVLTAANLRALGHSPGWALLLMLPGTTYFAFNRFDAWPAAFVSLALLLQWKDRRAGAAAALGLGAMVKWYPILLLPLFLAYNLRRDRDAKGSAGGWRGVTNALPSAVLVPGVAAAAVCLGMLAVTFVQKGGGLDAVLKVYQHHAGRNHNMSSLVAALVEPWRWGVFPISAVDGVAKTLAALQFLPALLLALLPVRTPRALLLGCLAVVLGFAQFGRVFSPQWICWVTPLAVLLAPGSRTVRGLQVALELLIYVQIPVLYYETMAGPEPVLRTASTFWIVSDTRLVLLLAFWAWSLWAIVRTVGRPPLPAST